MASKKSFTRGTAARERTPSLNDAGPPQLKRRRFMIEDAVVDLVDDDDGADEQSLPSSDADDNQNEEPATDIFTADHYRYSASNHYKSSTNIQHRNQPPSFTAQTQPQNKTHTQTPTFNRQRRFATPRASQQTSVPAHPQVSPSQQTTSTSHAPPATNPVPRARPHFLAPSSSIPDAAHASSPQPPLFPHRPAPPATTAPPLLPDAFSPRRGNAHDRLAPNGWAAQLRTWILDASGPGARAPAPAGAVLRVGSAAAAGGAPGDGCEPFVAARAARVGAAEEQMDVVFAGAGAAGEHAFWAPRDGGGGGGGGEGAGAVRAGMLVRLRGLTWSVRVDDGAGTARDVVVCADWRVL